MDDAASFGPVTPIVPAEDVDRSLAFYVEILGFEEVFRSGTPTNYAGLRRGLATIHLFACTEPNIAAWTAFRVSTDRIDSLYEHCQEAGIVHPNGSLGPRPWGTRDFTVLDPAGVCVTFWERESGARVTPRT